MSKNTKRYKATATVIVASVVGVLMLTPYVLSQRQLQSAEFIQFQPVALPTCSVNDELKIDPQVTGADQTWRWHFSCPTSSGDVHIFRFNGQGPGKEATADINTFSRPEGNNRADSIDGFPVFFRTAGTRREVIADWFVVGDRVYRSVLETKIAEALEYFNSDPVAVSRIVVLLRTADTHEDANQQLRRVFIDLRDQIAASYAGL